MKDKRLFKLYGELDHPADDVLDNFNSTNDSIIQKFRQKKDFYSWITNRGSMGNAKLTVIRKPKAYDRLVKYRQVSRLDLTKLVEHIIRLCR